MDNETGQLLKLYPLMDHDHAFSEDNNIPSQTSERDETLQEAAMEAAKHVALDYENVLEMDRPEDINESIWEAVLGRCGELRASV